MKHKKSDLNLSIGLLMERYFPLLRRTVRRNLARLTTAFLDLDLALSVRFGYGGLHLTSVARALPEGFKFKSRYKWLSRFLKCKYFDPSSLAECMLGLIVGRQPSPWLIVLIDQTTVDGVEVVNAAIPLAGRAVPVAWVDFQYPWTSVRPPSQNFVELCLFTWLAQAAPPGVRLILIFDRGYARVALVQELNRTHQPFLIRGRGNVIVQAQVRGRRQRISLGRLPHRTGQPLRYRHVLYHAGQAEPVDVVVWIRRDDADLWAKELAPVTSRPAPGRVTMQLTRDPFVLSLASDRNGIQVADPVQLYLDCRAAGESALEAADAIRAEMRW